MLPPLTDELLTLVYDGTEEVVVVRADTREDAVWFAERNFRGHSRLSRCVLRGPSGEAVDLVAAWAVRRAWIQEDCI